MQVAFAHLGDKGAGDAQGELLGGLAGAGEGFLGQLEEVPEFVDGVDEVGELLLPIFGVPSDCSSGYHVRLFFAKQESSHGGLFYQRF